MPLRHPLALTRVAIEFLAEDACASSAVVVNCIVTVETTSPTGVEIEALTAVQIALLTVYDMCKVVDQGIVIDKV